MKLLAVALLVWGFRVDAGTQGILEGIVKDRARGEPLPGVNVQIEGLRIGASTDLDGYYRIHSIRAGTYQVRFTHIGYRPHLATEVIIHPDLRTRLNASLEQSDISLDEVVIVQERPLLQKDLPATAYSIGESTIEKLPVSSLQEILTLQPGTTIEGNVRGGKTTEVVYLVDGLPIQDVMGGGVGATVPKGSITRMTVHTGGFDAEYGNALSGVVNMVTKSGGARHTLGFRLEHDSWIPEYWNKQQDRATELEATASGPISVDRIYYFTANTIALTDTRWWQDFQRFYISPVSREFAGFTKLEYELQATMRLSLQGIYSVRDWRDYEFSWRFNLDGLPPRSRDSYRIAMMLSHTISPTSYYSVSLSRMYQRSRIGEGPRDASTLSVYEYDFFLRYVVEGTRNWWADTRQAIHTLKGDITSQLGRAHVFKAGLELNHYDVVSDLVKYEPQTSYFGKPIVTAPLLSHSNQYSYGPRSGSIYVQDKADIVEDGSNFSAGVRWDFFDPTAQRPIVEFVPIAADEYRQEVAGFTKARFKHQFSPRLAFATPVGPSTFLFVNFGHYFQFPLFDYLYSGITPSQVRSGTRSVLVGNPDLEPERTVAWELGVKHGLTSHNVISAAYFKKSFKNQIDSKTLIPFDSKSAGDYGFASYVNNANAEAYGIEIVLSQERGERITGNISYTYMVTEGVSEYADQTINYAQWGFPLVAQPFPLSWDQRHAIKMEADVKLPFQIQATLVALYNSPRPFTYYPTRDGFTPLDSTKAFLPNNRRMEDVLFLHAKLTRAFQLFTPRQVAVVFVDARNIFNRKNIRWMDSSGRIGGELADPGAYYDPRRIRLGVRVDL